MKKKSCEWNGVQYESISAAARALGISYGAMQGRVLRGHTCKKDLHAGRRKKCTWNGVQYDSVREAAKANHVTPQAMVMRLKKGYTCDDDLMY